MSVHSGISLTVRFRDRWAGIYVSWEPATGAEGPAFDERVSWSTVRRLAGEVAQRNADMDDDALMDALLGELGTLAAKAAALRAEGKDPGNTL